MEQEKNKNGIVALLVVVIIILLVLVILLATETISFKSQTTNNTKDDTQIIENNDTLKEEILDKAIGEWGMCDNNHACYGINIAKSQEQKYTYRPYQMWSDGFYGGNVEIIEKTNDTTITLTVHYEAVHNMVTDIEEHTNKYVIDISKVDQNIIIVDSVEYKKIIGDRELFFNQLNS